MKMEKKELNTKFLFHIHMENVIFETDQWAGRWY